MVRVFFLFLFLLCFELKALSVEEIIESDNATRLRFFVKKEKRKSFLKILCKKQKEKRKAPTACYELGWDGDEWCLRLSWKDMQFMDLQIALESPFLSSVCRQHLEQKQKLFIYRRKDFLLLELKNYWTEQKFFFYKEGDARPFPFQAQ